ncbi:MAG: glycosyl transferase family 1 [Proteobacteria bacterium]|nr:MAG: glycosyl transferase family 1 [Pseudomonadota bacterium]
MKIVDVAEFYADQGGGVKTYINQKLAAGAERGHEVVIIAPGPQAGEQARHGGRIVWIPGPPMPFDPRYYVLWRQSEVHRALDAERPDLVEGSSPWSGGWFAARWRGDAPKAFIFHQDPVAVYPQTFVGGVLGPGRVDRLFAPYWSYLRRLSSRFDATVVSGQWLADKLGRFGLERPVAVPFGIDKAAWSPDHARGEVRARLAAACGVDPDAPLWVGVSRFHPEKRLGTLLDAFARASKARPMGFVLFGDGPLAGWLRRRAAKIPGLHLAGYTKDRRELATALASSDAFLHGSAAETYGLVVAEALCSGLPLVVPDVGGAADLAAPAWAETYPAGDARACAAAMGRLLARDPATLKRAVAGAAADRVGTMADHFDQLFALYERLAAERS